MNSLRTLGALLAGCFVTLSLAPFKVWPLAILAAALLYHCLKNRRPQVAACLVFVFSLALFGSGASWVYVSIHEFGYIAAPLAAVFTALFCAVLALINTIAWLPFCWLGTTSKPDGTGGTGRLLLFASTALFAEWLRGWIFTGFPWLFAGYGQVDGPLAAWAPIGGVYLASFIVYLSGATLAELAQLRLRGLLQARQRRTLSLAALLATGWLLTPLLGKVAWTQVDGKPVSVSIVQTNISQHDKWRPELLRQSLELYESMSSAEWAASDLVVWPEAAVAREYHAGRFFLLQMASLASRHNSALLTGVPWRDQDQRGGSRMHNSVVALGAAEGVYHKQKLVPFGEYIPLENLLGPLLEMIALPLSSMAAGDAGQQPLQVHGWHTQPLICYEVVYPSLAARAAQASDALLTVSNDAWFGASLGPLQHLQMARMRALENGRYMIRSTGTGISAIIDHRGNSVVQSGQFTAETLRGEILLRSGNTPWTAGGYWLLPLANALLLAGLAFISIRDRKRSSQKECGA